MAMPRRGPAQIIEGTLDRHAPAEVVSQLWREGATGILLLKRGDEEKKAVFRDGTIIYATSTNKSEKLGYLLVEEGRVTKEDILAAAREKSTLRDYLVERGILDEEAFEDAMVGLITDIVATAFDWSRGDFSFMEKEDVEIAGEVGHVSMPDLFLEGVRCIEDVGRIREALGEEDAEVMPGTDPEVLAHEVHLEPSEELIFSQIDGSSSLGETVSQSMMGPEMTQRFLYALVLSGHLEVEGRSPKGLPRPSRRSKMARQRRVGGRRGVRKSVLSRKKQEKKQASASSKEAAAQQAEEAPAAEEPFEQQIRRLHGQMVDQNHYELLGVAQAAEGEEIRKSYHELARKFHPDKLGPSADDELRRKLEQLFGRFGEAYNVLRDAERRKEYDEQLASGKTESKDVDPREAAREAFEKGKAMLRADAAAAARFFQYAVDQDPEQGRYWQHLGVALSGQSMSRKRAEEAFLKAIDLNPSNYKIYFQLGMLYKEGGLKTRAIEMLRKGLQWDPENIKMQQALAELTGADDKSGGLGGLFRKK